MLPIISFWGIARALSITVDYIYKIRKGKHKLHRKHNQKLREYYNAKKQEIDRFLESLDDRW